MATPNIVPRADSEGGIGTSSKYWASAYIDLIYVGAGKIGRDADNLLDFSVDNEVTFRVNAADEMVLGASTLSPHASDGLALGTSSLMWSDLFLASGAVVNFDNGNLTLTHSSNRLTLADSDELAFGAGNDLRIYHNATNSYIENYTGNLYIQQTVDDGDMIFTCDDGSGGVTAYITLDGGATRINVAKSMYFADSIEAAWGTNEDFTISHLSGDNYLTNDIGNMYIRQRANDGDMLLQCDDGSGGVATYLTLDGSDPALLVAKKMIFSDNTYLYVGGGADLQIVHNGTDSQVTNTTGNLQFTNTADDKDISFASDNGNGGDAIYFYLDGSSATYSGGATTNLFTNWPDLSVISLGTGHDLQIHHNGSSSSINNYTGNLFITQQADDGGIIFRSDDGSGGITEYLRIDGQYSKIFFYENARVVDSKKLYFGTGDDLSIYHDGSNSYIRDVGTGSLYLQTNGAAIYLQDTDGNAMAQFTDGGGSFLMYNGNLKLSTTNTGIAVTGGITVTGDSSVFTSANANDPVVEIKNTTNDNDAARLQFTKDRGAAAVAGDNIAQIDFVGENTAQETILYSRWVIDNNVASDGQEGGKVQLLIATHDAELQVGLELIDGNAEDEVDVTIANGADSLTTVSGDLTVVGDVVMMPNLPTSDPSNAGQLWSNSGVVTVSAG